MSLIYNPKTREPRRSDGDETPEVKAYLRCRTLDAGENFLTSKALRSLFGVDGKATHERIGAKLQELADNRFLTYQRIEHGGRVAYRIVLELLPEELPENALVVPKSLKDDMPDAQRIAQLFYRLQDDSLGIVKTFTIQDWQTCRRLLSSNSYAVVRGAVKRFWETKADQRKNPNFQEFYFNFARLANDAVDEIQVERAIKADKARKDRPKETHRDYLVREIKYQSKSDPEWAAELQKELEELDGEKG